MILYENDWKRYPTAIPDLKTTNQSFLDLAALYEDMGVRNNLFHLALMQPELSGVDPFDPTISVELCGKIAMEIKWNPWYYFREIARLPSNSGPDPVRFVANRGNIAMYWCFFNHIDCSLIQPRQTFKSGSVDTLMNGLLYTGMAQNTRIVMITKDDMLRQVNVERMKGIRDEFPKWLYLPRSDDANNQKELTCNALGNAYITGVARSSESAANNLGRGITTPIIQFDEGPFITWIGKTVQAALAAGTKARVQAAEANQPYGNIFTTTAGKIDSRDGRYIYDMITAGTIWNELFFDCRNVRELHVTMRQNMGGEDKGKGKIKKLFMNITMSHRQLGYSDEWLFNAMAESQSTGEDADRDFLNIWTSGSQRSPLSSMLNETIRNSEMEPLFYEMAQPPERYLLRWYIPEKQIESMLASGQFVIGCDTSDAVGRDAITLVFTDLRDLSVVAVGTYNETMLPRFAAFLLYLLVKYVNTTLIIERKSSAQTIIDYLCLKLPMYGQDPMKRMFNKIVDESRENPEPFAEIGRALNLRNEAFYERRKNQFGFVPTQSTRQLLYTTVLQNAAKQAGYLVRDRVLSNEIRKLVEKNGRIDHDASGHDDHVIAWLLTHYFANHGKNLQHYGIDSSRILTHLGQNGNHVTDEEREERLRQQGLLDEFDGLMDRLKGDLDDLTALKYEHRLRVLSTRMNSSTDIDGPSIDSMIRQAGEERRKRNQIMVQQQRFRPSFASAPLFGNTLSMAHARQNSYW